MAIKKARFVRAFLVLEEECVFYSSFWSYIFLAPYAAPAATSKAIPGSGVGLFGLSGWALKAQNDRIKARVRKYFFIFFRF